jgi:hypothetical protein
MRPWVKGALLLLLAFALGVAGGAAGFGAYRGRMEPWRSPEAAARFQQHVVARLTKELGLRPDQRQQVEVVLKETGQDFIRLREEFAPRFRELRTRARDRIRSVLDQEQQAKFANVEREWERRAEHWRGRGPQPEAVAPKTP